ncbi:outer membrane receptor for Fe3+-dicitrate [Belliella baltica DSM 15883]|uniref:Outer membrane receptor for Fe3+-dicitrate n=1 Tax=Belliella baltica (strain DSM 15883 / CIP 108006 / LMG 21964 / BA134) TaxID=866536 RepID=I3Z9U6_BELBD|nr:TonB-dependent receptor [Belliella baltica]AFL86014.1 outer membrane receptor for Fe3+-dicitrate [Belliella baltica DSM 15883]
MKLKLIALTCLIGMFLGTADLQAAVNNGDEKSLVITGKIKSLDGEIIPFANILVMGTVKGAYSNLDGTFAIYDLEDGEYTIKVSAVGFKTFTKEVNVKEGQINQLDLVFMETGVEMPQITVIADKDRVFSKVPGSVTYIDQRELNTISPISGNEVLRRSPGVHVVDEEGIGMRVNIGIRGLDPDRSRSVLVLEDGVPVALAPYGEPEMYYTPAIDRMAGVEILKGSGQILYGPQTIGGVVNYISPNPPQEQEGSIRIQGGQGGYFSGLVNYGNTFGNTGMQVNLLKKRADNVGPTSFDITDFNTKFLFNINDKSELGLKLGLYNEVSNSTYIGLNQVMYDQGGQDFTRLAPDDQLDVSRYSISFSHKYRFSEKVRLNTIAYAYTTTRNWNRQDFTINSTNTPPSNWTGVVWGDRDIPGGAIFMRDGTGNRNRQFAVGGIEPRLEVDHNLFNLKNELTVGTRLLWEQANEQRVNGTKAGVKSGDLVEDEVRTGNAFSAYAQNKFSLSEKIDFNIGVRYENFNYERDIRRRSFAGIGVRDTALVAGNVIHEIIPGMGFNYRPIQKLNFFGGIHKGYAPPRTKDAITSTGDVLDLNAEESWNYELGFRSELSSWAFMEMTGFFMDFSNQIIPVSESAGGLGFGVVNAGATRHRGVESALIFDFSNLLGFSKTKLTYDVNATYALSTYAADRFVDDVNINGNRTPYAPNWFVNSALTLETESGFGARLSMNYVGEQFGDELNTVVPSLDGRIGKIDAYTIFDAMLSYDVERWNSRFNLSIKNLSDERYIATRRPQGIKVGIPRFITAGYEFKF